MHPRRRYLTGRRGCTGPCFWRKENHIRQKELFFDILAAAEAFAWENKE